MALYKVTGSVILSVNWSDDAETMLEASFAVPEGELSIDFSDEFQRLLQSGDVSKEEFFELDVEAESEKEAEKIAVSVLEDVSNWDVYQKVGPVKNLVTVEFNIEDVIVTDVSEISK